MQIEPYIERVAEQLMASAALGDARTQEIAAALGETAHSAIQLALLQAVSGAAEEITAALFEVGAPGAPTVAAHFDGGELAFRVTLSEDPSPPPAADEKDATARISLRLSESLKSEIEQAAEREAVSVNAWLVRAARHLLSRSAPGWGAAMGGWAGWGPGGPAAARGGQHRITGWVSG
ncbi:MAG: toxin-antitoxin system HicB family antitoxin [Frankiaceae bacterium]|jgi:hypothetical protein|nr:toxin-antitoxin system HicB family antitoxin [Frankiaceae bacterium]